MWLTIILKKYKRKVYVVNINSSQQYVHIRVQYLYMELSVKLTL